MPHNREPQNQIEFGVDLSADIPERIGAGDGDPDGLTLPELASTLDSLIVIDGQGRIRFWNDVASEMFGYSFDEVYWRIWVDVLVPPEHRSAYLRCMTRYLDLGPADTLDEPVEIQAVRRDGDRFPAIVSVTRLPGISPKMLLGTVRDLSRQRATELERSDIANRFHTLVDQLPVVVFTDATDAHFTPLYVSQQIEKLLGYTVDEWLDDPESWQKNIHPDDKDWVIAQALGTHHDQDFELEYRMVHRQGHTVWVREKSSIYFGDDGKPLYAQGILIDVSNQKRTEEQIRATEAQYRSLVEQTPAITIRTDAVTMGRIEYVSPQIRKILGYEPSAWIENPKRFLNCIHPADRAGFFVAYRASIETGSPFNLEFRLFASDGREVWISASLELVEGDDGQPLFWQGILIDVTERRAMQDAIESLRARCQHFAAYSTDAIIVNDRNGKFLFANEAFTRMVGYEEEELSEISVLDLIAAQDIARVREIGLRMLHEGAPPDGPTPVRYITRSGDIVITEASFSLIYEHSEPIGFQVIIRDTTERARMEEALAYQAFHDSLTGLANHARLNDELSQRFGASDEDRDFALVFLDLDNFKVLNDSLGHDVGDLALAEVGRRIEDCINTGDFVSRLGGDEFIILLEARPNREAVARIAQRLVDAFDAPIRLHERTVTITASIGIALCTEEIERPAELVRRADLAMYESKASGRNRFTFHDPEMDKKAQDRLEIEADLRRALEEDQLVVVYQPTMSLTSKQIVGVEALVRWNHPHRGLLNPADFISVAEDTGLIVQIDRWVLDTALREIQSWPSVATGAPFLLNVNVSTRQLATSDFVEHVEELLNRYPTAGSVQLGLELNEAAVMSDVERAGRSLSALSDRGVWIVLDNFGMGYSSLAQLRKIPFDCIKIDRLVTSELGESDDALIIVSGIIEISHALGLSIIAEGVETEDQARILSYLDCDYAQGCHYGGPQPPDELVVQLEERAAPASVLAAVENPATDFSTAALTPMPGFDPDS